MLSADRRGQDEDVQDGCGDGKLACRNGVRRGRQRSIGYAQHDNREADTNAGGQVVPALTVLHGAGPGYRGQLAISGRRQLLHHWARFVQRLDAEKLRSVSLSDQLSVANMASA